VETKGGRAMDHEPDELVDAGGGQPHRWFGGLFGKRGAPTGRVKTPQIRFQARGQLRKCRFVEILAVLVFIRSLWNEVDLLK